MEYPEWMKFETYAELKAYCEEHGANIPMSDRFRVVNRMGELRYGPRQTQSLRNSEIKMYTMEEFRRMKEEEDRADIEKYGPR